MIPHIPPHPELSLASLRARAHVRRRRSHDCPTCGARESVHRGRCMTCGASMATEPGLVRRIFRRLLRRSS